MGKRSKRKYRFSGSTNKNYDEISEIFITVVALAVFLLTCWVLYNIRLEVCEAINLPVLSFLKKPVTDITKGTEATTKKPRTVGKRRNNMKNENETAKIPITENERKRENRNEGIAGSANEILGKQTNSGEIYKKKKSKGQKARSGSGTGIKALQDRGELVQNITEVKRNRPRRTTPAYLEVSTEPSHKVEGGMVQFPIRRNSSNGNTMQWTPLLNTKSKSSGNKSGQKRSSGGLDTTKSVVSKAGKVAPPLPLLDKAMSDIVDFEKLTTPFPILGLTTEDQAIVELEDILTTPFPLLETTQMEEAEEVEDTTTFQIYESYQTESRKAHAAAFPVMKSAAATNVIEQRKGSTETPLLKGKAKAAIDTRTGKGEASNKMLERAKNTALKAGKVKPSLPMLEKARSGRFTYYEQVTTPSPTLQTTQNSVTDESTKFSTPFPTYVSTEIGQAESETSTTPFPIYDFFEFEQASTTVPILENTTNSSDVELEKLTTPIPILNSDPTVNQAGEGETPNSTLETTKDGVFNAGNLTAAIPMVETANSAEPGNVTTLPIQQTTTKSPLVEPGNITTTISIQQTTTNSSIVNPGNVTTLPIQQTTANKSSLVEPGNMTTIISIQQTTTNSSIAKHRNVTTLPIQQTTAKPSLVEPGNIKTTISIQQTTTNSSIDKPGNVTTHVPILQTTSNSSSVEPGNVTAHVPILQTTSNSSSVEPGNVTTHVPILQTTSNSSLVEPGNVTTLPTLKTKTKAPVNKTVKVASELSMFESAMSAVFKSDKTNIDPFPMLEPNYPSFKSMTVKEKITTPSPNYDSTGNVKVESVTATKPLETTAKPNEYGRFETFDDEFDKLMSNFPSDDATEFSEVESDKFTTTVSSYTSTEAVLVEIADSKTLNSKQVPQQQTTEKYAEDEIKKLAPTPRSMTSRRLKVTTESFEGVTEKSVPSPEESTVERPPQASSDDGPAGEKTEDTTNSGECYSYEDGSEEETTTSNTNGSEAGHNNTESPARQGDEEASIPGHEGTTIKQARVTSDPNEDKVIMEVSNSTARVPDKLLKLALQMVAQENQNERGLYGAQR